VSSYYLTTPIYYANDLPHVGHAYTTIAADAVARFHRLRGEHVFLLTGTDEHGVNIERIAALSGRSATEHVDYVAGQFRDLWAVLDISYDRFIRTTEVAHRRAVLAFWERLRASGDLYRATYTGAYCVRCEAYYQAEDLVDERCPVHKLACDIVSEENWFFRLSRYQSALETLVGQSDFVQPITRRNEVLSVIRQGLRDFSVSRRNVRWGIPVPENSEEVIYVWVDALANYLTGVGFPDDTLTFERYWPAQLHLVGKEIIRFHCLYWPALLLSAGLTLPRQVFAHGWLTKDSQKISKTTGNIIDTRALAAEFGSDALRYFLLRGIPFGQDGDFTRSSFIARYNADLANDFGNLVHRTSTLAARHLRTPPSAYGTLGEAADAAQVRVADAFNRLALHEAVASVGEFVSEINRYLEATRPWQLEREHAAEVVAEAAAATCLAAQLYEPVIPRAAREAQSRLTGGRVGPPLFPRYSC
jgi:methionyl-tRNA synthetase